MNGHTPQPRVPTAGIWAPAITFFTPSTDTLDLAAQTKYYTYMSQHLTGLVVLGTNAETFMLTREERATLLKTARQAVGPDYEIMAGVGGHSTKQVLEFISDAVEARADYVLVLPCAYFGPQTSKAVVMRFYEEVAEKSPLPVVVVSLILIGMSFEEGFADFGCSITSPASAMGLISIRICLSRCIRSTRILWA